MRHIEFKKRPRGLRKCAAWALSTALLSMTWAQAQADQTTLRWVGCGISKKSYVTALAKAYEERTGIKVDLQGGGATKGIRDVAAIEADVGGSCRRKLQGASVESAAKLVPVAWDALAVITHKDNPVDNISVAQLQDMMRGEIDNWSELGGPDADIELFVREGKISGVGHALRAVLFNDPELEFGAADQRFASSGPLEKAVTAAPHSVGITGVSSARKRDVKILQLEGKEPSYENVRSGDYLLYRPLYLVHNTDSPRSDEIKRFIQFAYSKEGMDIISANGTVPYLEAMHLLRKSRNEIFKARGNSDFLAQTQGRD